MVTYVKCVKYLKCQHEDSLITYRLLEDKYDDKCWFLSYVLLNTVKKLITLRNTQFTFRNQNDMSNESSTTHDFKVDKNTYGVLE